MPAKKTTSAAADQPAEVDTQPAWKGSLSSDEPLVGPDGHVHLSEEDLKARAKADA